MAESMSSVCDQITNPNDKLTPIPYAPPRFYVDDPAALEYLKQEGYAVIKNVLSIEEIETGKRLAWKWLKSYSKEINPNNIKSWNNWPKGRQSGIFFTDGIGQSDFMWYLRERPNVIKTFENVWGTKELVTSFDGCTILRPPDFSPLWKTSPLPYHLDQNLRLLPGFQCVQGGLNLLDSEENDGGFVVLPQSHLAVHKLFKLEPYKQNSTHFVKLPMDANQVPWTTFLSHLPRPIKVCLKAGDFVLWDSRAIHGNVPPSLVKDPSSSKYNSIRRIAAFICMVPASHVKDPKIFQKRIEGVKTGATTSHWPISYLPNVPFPSNFKPPKLNLTQLKLISPQIEDFSDFN